MKYSMNFKDDEMRQFYQYEGKLATYPIIKFMAKCSSRYHGKFVDLGCGNKPYMDFFNHADCIIGLDIADSASADIIANAKFVPVKSNSIDVVICNQVIEHESEPEKIIVEIERILKEGGALILSAPQMVRLHGEPHDYYRYTRWGLKYLLEKNGMKIEVIESHGGIFRSIGSHLDFFIIDYFGKINLLKKILRYTVITMNNFIFNILDKFIYWEKDTLGHNVIAKKERHQSHGGKGSSR
jgi:SAM-dependent methyltransferase